jgi:hypothetical protein
VNVIGCRQRRIELLGLVQALIGDRCGHRRIVWGSDRACCQAPRAQVAGVAEDNCAAGRFNSQCRRRVEHSVQGCTAIACGSCFAVAGDGVDFAIADRDSADAFVIGVSDQHVATEVQRDTGRRVELRAGGCAAVAAGPRCAVGGPGKGSNVAPADFANTIVALIHNINRIAVAADGDAGWMIKPCGSRRSAIAAVTYRAGSGNGCELAILDFADAVVVSVGEINIAGRIYGHAHR